ncbi:hypothetical protein RhiirA4_478314 [Rhizophagus irregularis]|uniref:Uncharacterized protein n=1 Tax=Rhizophagus irregularis TaxID=588596 RepID=A0A2I1HEK8_9GLOM|nr:hypothetical protein RhiirA4_478314 [Rhizophagus irregularis]
MKIDCGLATSLWSSSIGIYFDTITSLSSLLIGIIRRSNYKPQKIDYKLGTIDNCLIIFLYDKMFLYDVIFERLIDSIDGIESEFHSSDFSKFNKD